MKHYKNILSFIISLLLMFTLLLTQGLIFFKQTIIDDSYYRQIISNNDTTNKIYENIYKDINYILLSNNIPVSVSKDIITVAEIDDYIENSISNVESFSLGRSEEIPVLNVDAYMERLNLSINTYIKDNNVGLTKSTAAVFAEVKKSAKEVISSELEMVDYNSLSKSGAGQKLQKVVTTLSDSKVFLGLIIADVILSILLIIIWRRRIHRASAWVGYSFVSSGLLVSIVAYSGIISKFYENAAVPSIYLKENISSIIEGYFNSLSKIGIVFVLIGLLFMIFNWIHLYKRYKKTKLM